MPKSAEALIQQQQNHLQISGAINFDNVVALARNGMRLLASMSEAHIDLTGVTYGNSAAIALMLTWLRFCRKRGITMVYTHIPAQLIAIARLCDVMNLLPVGE